MEGGKDLVVRLVDCAGWKDWRVRRVGVRWIVKKGVVVVDCWMTLVAIETDIPGYYAVRPRERGG